MRDLAKTFPRDDDLENTLGNVTAAAVALLDTIDYADVMMVDGDKFRSVQPTDPLITELDALQMSLQQGPCLEAATGESVVRCPDMSTESRWPEFAAAAVEAGVKSMLSFQLYTHSKGTGALNLFSKKTFDGDINTESVGALLATHAAVAITAANTYTQLQSALATRDLIGQAKGAIMERFTVDAVRAFALLTKLSQDTNTPLRILARQVVDSIGADKD